jgi:hypothetical protein
MLAMRNRTVSAEWLLVGYVVLVGFMVLAGVVYLGCVIGNFAWGGN